MILVRKNRIYVPDGNLSWAMSHAMNPTVDILDNDTLRVYFSSLDAQGVGRIGYVDVNAANPEEVLYISSEPVLDIGLKGCFDDNGVVPSCIKTVGNLKYLYYYGFQKVEKVRFLLFTGLAVSHDGGKSFERFSKTPVLDRTNDDLYIRSLPYILIEDGIWKMWYSGVNRWVEIMGKELPFGEVKYVESTDGIHFTASQLCLTPYEDEFSLSRAFVFKRKGQYHMVFSRRMKTDTYKMGYAQSKDGINWHRDDSKILVSEATQDWDSEMICYTSVIEVKDKAYLFYNGNNFGRTGFGYAEIIEN
jgi:hypothetical protein